ncbi:hypothetical protein CAOG_01687 [Capsaspora owczarzaki ATCC 30864]|uniref:CRAL-TRIO domain-containing protein n=1 Tax=Capsaspora owczarzaki (strain ATCC 30864) TaxID=595528 RepID=A0A0D2WJR2_CAPO3|nr:hypothetical protein CAOG_01687 [Capsaspora owczarzaki ATCC 30864]KJE90365.1 hypothetical protein CAOG_001687 [Capsaspora owczarzaki ATCC 30864]|eukprot:XP_004364555.1 hypothetical protein CAOG_01687 [Capsaspora owczarzaki ATCC 30864]
MSESPILPPPLFLARAAARPSTPAATTTTAAAAAAASTPSSTDASSLAAVEQQQAQPVHSDGFVPRVALTPSQVQAIEQLQEKLNVPGWTVRQWRYIHEGGCLARYLRARDWDVEKAHQLMLGTLTWREEFKVHEISPEDPLIVEEGLTGKTYRHGRDRAGRPIIYMKPRFQNTKNYAEQVRYTVHHLEQAMRSMNLHEGVEQMTLLIDFQGYSVMNAPPMSQTKEVMSILLNCYPERLGLALMVDAPFLFNMAYKVVYPFLPTETRKKIHFISGNQQSKATSLSQHIDLETLEHDYGGLVKAKYDSAAYTKAEAEELGRFKAHHADLESKETDVPPQKA